MRFWKKIFLYSVTLTIVLITVMGVVFIERIHYTSLDRTISNAIENQKNIVSSIYLRYDNILLYNYGNEVGRSFELILRNYIYNNIANIEDIQIFNDKGQVITDINDKRDIEGANDLLANIKGNENFFTIRDYNNKKVILIGSEFKLANNNYKLILMKDISYIYKERVDNYKLFIILSILINILLVIGMYIISKYVTKPIVNLSKLSVEVSKGEYNNRAYYNGSNDEVGILTKNFNNMLKSLQLKMNELEELNIHQERFINNLTHEIKTPITSIIGYSDLLLKANINNEIREKAINYINSEGRRLEGLSSTLIKLTRIKNKDIDMKEVNIDESIKEAICILRRKIYEKNMEITLDNSLTNNIIMADSELFIILIKNILENSIKASDKGKTILVSVFESAEGHIKVKVNDEGCGIPKEDLENILEPFYMVDKARDRSQNGMGLGLAICKEICNLFNITINIKSEENKGTEVVLTIIS